MGASKCCDERRLPLTVVPRAYENHTESIATRAECGGTVKKFWPHAPAAGIVRLR